MTATFPPDADPLEVATTRADRAITLARGGHRQRAMMEIVQGRARLRRTGLADCPTSQEVRRRLRAAEAVVDGLDVDADYLICDPTGRKWRPVTETDTVTGGVVFVPEGLPERYSADSGPLGVMPVDGPAPDDSGAVCVDTADATLWYPFADCYLPIPHPG